MKNHEIKMGKKLIKPAKKSISKKKLRIALPLLQILSILPPKSREIIVKHLNTDACEILYTSVCNTLYNRDLLNKGELRIKLNPYKNNLRYIINENKKSNLRHKKLIQIGGNPLGLILGATLPILFNYLFKYKK